MQREEIERVVLRVLAGVLECCVSPETSRGNTPQWDSLKHIQIVFAIEDELGIEFSEQEMSRLGSVREIVDMARSHHAS